MCRQWRGDIREFTDRSGSAAFGRPARETRNECEGFLVETPTRRIGRVVGIRSGVSQDEPEAIAVRAGRFGLRVVLISVNEVEQVLPEERRIVVRDPPRLLPV
jgi:hypothetical protein